MEYISALITGLPFLISHLFVTLCLLFIGITMMSVMYLVFIVFLSIWCFLSSRFFLCQFLNLCDLEWSHDHHSSIG